MAYQRKDRKPVIPIKFASAFDKNSGRTLELAEIRRAFFEAANDPKDPKKSVQSLRQTFNLVCPHCKQAELTFSFGCQEPSGRVKKIAGSNIQGQLSHIKTKGGSTHGKSCIATVFPHESLHPIDETAGYKIYLNLKEPVDRNPRNGVLVSRAANNRVIAYDQDLISREPKSIYTAADISQLINTEAKKGRGERLGQSIVVYGDQKTPWKQFFLRNEDRMKNFVQRAIPHEFPMPTRIKTRPFALTLEFDLKTTVSTHSGDMGRTKIYKFPLLEDIEHPLTGKRVRVQPQLHVQNEHLFDEIKDIHRRYGQLFVVAANPQLYQSPDDANLLVLQIKLRDPDMMVVEKDTPSVVRRQHASQHPSPSVAA